MEISAPDHWKWIYLLKTSFILSVCDDEKTPKHVSNMHLLSNVFSLPGSVSGLFSEIESAASLSKPGHFLFDRRPTPNIKNRCISNIWHVGGRRSSVFDAQRFKQFASSQSSALIQIPRVALLTANQAQQEPSGLTAAGGPAGQGGSCLWEPRDASYYTSYFSFAKTQAFFVLLWRVTGLMEISTCKQTTHLASPARKIKVKRIARMYLAGL